MDCPLFRFSQFASWVRCSEQASIELQVIERARFSSLLLAEAMLRGNPFS